MGSGKPLPVLRFCYHLAAFDHLRVQLAEFTDDNGNSYSHKPLEDADKNKLNRAIGPNDTPEQERQKITNVLSSPKLKQGFMEKIFKSQENAAKDFNLKHVQEMEQRVSRAPSM